MYNLFFPLLLPTADTENLYHGLFIVDDVKVLNFNRGTDIQVSEDEYSQTC
jgi:hypothetical protein